MDATTPPVVLEVDTAVYRVAAIKKACYRLADRCHSTIEAIAPNRARITLTARQAGRSPATMIDDFNVELLDQELREVVAEETAAVRNLILAQAFSATSLTSPAGDTGGVEDDVLHIKNQ